MARKENRPYSRHMRTERASFFWGAGAFSLACGALAIIMRLAGVGLAVGPIVVRWYLLALCAGLSGLLMALLARRTWVQVLGALAMVPVLGILALGGLTLLGSGAIPSLPVQRLDAPEARPYSVVVRESRDWIDPMYDLTVEGTGPIAQSWYVGCINGDFESLQDLRWRSAEEFVVVVGSGDDSTTHVVRVDRSSGRVSVSGGDDEWNC